MDPIATTRPTRRQYLAATAATGAAALMTDVSGPRAARSQPSGRTFVLVHGAWHGGWCWRRVVDLLQAQGHKVFAPSLSGLAERAHLLDGGLKVGLETHIADVANLIRWEDLSDIVLCGHSYGGMVISGVAERLAGQADAIRALVFLDAFVPAHGEALADIASPAVRETLAGLIARNAPTMPPVPAAVFRVNEADRAWVDAKCTPQPLATFTERVVLTGARERIARKVYVRAAGYPSPGFDAARAKLAGDAGWRVLEVPCGHDAMVDMPERVAEILADSAD